MRLNKLCPLLLTLCFPLFATADYTKNELAKTFIKEMTEEGFSEEELVTLFSQVEKKQSIIDAMNRPAEKRLDWGDYRKIFMEEKRIANGAAFWNTYSDALDAASVKYGVPQQVIVAIIGVETRYGRIMGSYKVLDALSTLAFDYPKRAKFFRKELNAYLWLVREQKMDPLSQKGSYAGAMGYGQFMPSSYRAYAIDGDQDGVIDIWKNPVDAIFSVANYLSRFGWKADQMVAVPVNVVKDFIYTFAKGNTKPEKEAAELYQLGVYPKVLPKDQQVTLMQFKTGDKADYWLGLKNFYVITRYNHSYLYAMAVYQLSEEVRQSYQNLLKAAKRDIEATSK